MAEVTISSGRIKQITDLPVSDPISPIGNESIALVQSGVTKQSKISNIGAYTKSLDYSTWVYGNSSTSTWVNSNSSKFLIKNVDTIPNTQIIPNNVIITGTLCAIGQTTLVKSNMIGSSALNISNLDPNSYSLRVYQISGSSGIASFNEGSLEVFHIGNATDIDGNVNQEGVIGIKTSTPNKTLSINGDLSASSHIWTSGNFYGDGTFITQISGGNIRDFSIPTSKIQGQLNVSSLIPLNSISGVQLSDFANIKGSQLASNAAIVGTQLASNANIVATQLANNTLTTSQIASNAGILGSQLASNAGITGSQISNNSITTNHIVNGTITQSDLATGAPGWDSTNVYLSATSGAVLIDDNQQKRISWNDGGGNFNIRAGNYFNSGLFYVKGSSDSNGGAATISLGSDASDGVINLMVAPIGVPNSAVTYTNGLYLSKTNLTTTLDFVAGGDVTAYSDEKLKKDIKTIDNALEKVNQLRGVEYTRIDTDKKQIGVIAQEVEKVIPEVVLQTEEYKSVSYGNIVGLLIEAVKDLTKEVETLKKQLNNS